MYINNETSVCFLCKNICFWNVDYADFGCQRWCVEKGWKFSFSLDLFKIVVITYNIHNSKSHNQDTVTYIKKEVSLSQQKDNILRAVNFQWTWFSIYASFISLFYLLINAHVCSISRCISTMKTKDIELSLTCLGVYLNWHRFI